MAGRSLAALPPAGRAEEAWSRFPAFESAFAGETSWRPDWPSSP